MPCTKIHLISIYLKKAESTCSTVQLLHVLCTQSSLTMTPFVRSSAAHVRDCSRVAFRHLLESVAEKCERHVRGEQRENDHIPRAAEGVDDLHIVESELSADAGDEPREKDEDDEKVEGEHCPQSVDHLLQQALLQSREEENIRGSSRKKRAQSVPCGSINRKNPSHV